MDLEYAFGEPSYLNYEPIPLQPHLLRCGGVLKFPKYAGIAVFTVIPLLFFYIGSTKIEAPPSVEDTVVSFANLSDTPFSVEANKSETAIVPARWNTGAAPRVSIPARFQTISGVGRIDTDWLLGNAELEKEDWNLVQDVETMNAEEGCLTYNERYQPYSVPLDATIPVPPSKHSTTAVLYRIRREHLQEPLHPDRLNAYRAIVSELQDISGIDVYFAPELTSSEWERELWFERVPQEFAARVLPFIYLDAAANYSTGTFHDLYYDNVQLSLVHFMNLDTSKQYDFVWYLEGDVRTTSSWTALFNHINASIPLQQPEPYAWETRQQHKMELEQPWQPDLILTNAVRTDFKAEEIYGNRGVVCNAFLQEKHLANAFVHLTGISRRLSDLAHAYFSLGYSCYCELFLPSIAIKHELPIFVVESPSWYKPSVSLVSSYHHVDWSPFYREWVSDESVCRPGPALVHKVL